MNVNKKVFSKNITLSLLFALGTVAIVILVRRQFSVSDIIGYIVGVIVLFSLSLVFIRTKNP